MSRNMERYVRALRDQVARLEVPQAVEERFGRFRVDPAGFCREVLGVESGTRRSGHGVGKTTIDAWATLWWLTTRPLSRVIVLAPEYSRQIRAVLFSEMRKWVRRARVSLPLTVHASRMMVEGYGEEWSATGMSASGEVDRLEGFHAEGGVLVIVDEMKGVPQDAFDAVQGALCTRCTDRI